MTTEDKGTTDDRETALCRSGRHTLCVHVLDAVQWSPAPYEVVGDLTSAALCTCACHLDCPMAAQGRATDWPAVCRCPGTLFRLEREREGRSERSTLGRSVRASLDRSRRTTAAREELRGRAQGLARDDVDRLVVEIWSAHGIPVPPAHARALLVDWAMGLTGLFEGARTNLDVLGGTGRVIARLVKAARDDEEAGADEVESEFLVLTGRQSVPVDLDPDVQPLLTALSDRATFASRTATLVPVILHEAAGGEIEVWEHPATGEVSAGRLGLIPGPEAGPFRASLAAASRVGQTAVCDAVRTGSPDGRWRLFVKLPLSERDLGEGL